ncbi:TBPIP-domain-containing protein [Punctularia strigosozonata HHB-11173 SS5]|uniref:TBPIP-domain-containing protein n=1 Tax=Punctularia strigosozonata (strain HHB-11173) TaxID=741275 RepID=UPI0004417A40|nr:TBPIP-domain-containing protein [Punctularia strigosozonata HHB-11173 SS5]EIN14573.1 TBPIP-domain-containing protein [Punctularia strigosozonata HHB-11173 SS5]
MSSKSKQEKATVLKGQEAEDKILNYIKRMNRPYGAVDVSANLKGAVPKAATQKILASLAEKGELIQKTYGKTTFFVADQAKIPALTAEEITTMQSEITETQGRNKLMQAEIRQTTAELAKLRNAPTDTELATQIEQIEKAIQRGLNVLAPLRSGMHLISADDIATVDVEWDKWRSEWLRRKQIFQTLWGVATDSLSPQENASLAEELGIEHDTAEHKKLDAADKATLNTRRLR